MEFGFLPNKGKALLPVVFELLGKGRELADELGSELSAVLLGHNIEGLSSELIAFGADQVIEIDDPALKHFGMRVMLMLLPNLL